MLAQALAFLCLTVGSTIKSRNPIGPGLNSEPVIFGANLTDLWWEDARYPDHLKFESKPGCKPGWPVNRLSVVPKYKLAFLLIEKCAGTQFNNLMEDLGGVSGGSPGWLHNTAPHHFGLSLEDLKQESGWRWAVFIRLPIARYLSAWGSKCQYGEDRDMERNCLCGSECRVDHAASLQAKVNAFHAHLRDSKKDMDDNNGMRHRANPHWQTQASFLKLYDVPFEKYDFVGHLRGDVHGQVREMLRMVGAPEEAADKHFPKDHIAGHQSALGSNIEEFYRGTWDVFNQLWYHDDQMIPGMSQ
jgi:hypothetical protein